MVLAPVCRHEVHDAPSSYSDSHLMLIYIIISVIFCNRYIISVALPVFQGCVAPIRRNLLTNRGLSPGGWRSASPAQTLRTSSVTLIVAGYLPETPEEPITTVRGCFPLPLRCRWPGHPDRRAARPPASRRTI